MKLLILILIVSNFTFADENYGSDITPESINVASANSISLSGGSSQCKNCAAAVNGKNLDESPNNESTNNEGTNPNPANPNR